MLTQLREQSLAFWRAQSRTQRMVILALALTGVVLVPLLATWASTPSYALAFSGLSEADAGQIVEQLTSDGTPYRLRGSGTILVPSDEVYDVRLRMARDGLPEGGSVGYELFNGGSVLGMTEFTQRLNYKRALEGELERTIGSLHAVEAVRVHVVTPEKTLLASEQALATASVTIKVRSGVSLDAAQVRAITQLVASSVEGLRPENVAVVDVDGNLLAAGANSQDSQASSLTDGKRAAEGAAANELEAGIQNLLTSILGPNRSVVRASVAMDWTTRETTTESFDPETAAVRSSQVLHEAYSTSGTLPSGVPGASSNLPTPVPTTTSGTTPYLYERTEETTNYEVTQIQSHEVVSPGGIERVTLSVLVDGMTDPAALETLSSVIAAAAGIDTARGDALAVETLTFDRTYFEEQAAEMDSQQRTSQYWEIGKWVAVVLVIAAALWYVQRLLSNLRLASASAWTPILKPAAQAFQLQSTTASASRPGAAVSLPQALAQPSATALARATPLTPEDEQVQRAVTQLAEQNPSSVADIIHLWLTEDEHRNG